MGDHDVKTYQGREASSLIQGALYALVYKHLWLDPQHVILVEEVDQDVDDNGDYLPYFDITMHSGTKVRVRVEEVAQ